MRTDAREMLAVGIFGGRSRMGARLETLLLRGRKFSPRISAVGVTAGTVVLSALMVAGTRAPRWIAFAQRQPLSQSEARAQPAMRKASAETRPSFDAASVKLNPDCSGDHQDEQFSPGRVSVTCITLRNLVEAAYVTFSDGVSRNPTRLRIFGAPDWAGSSGFNIIARAEGNPPMEQMFGPMLQMLLEERFRLRVHRELRQLPVYTMTVATGGLKIHTTKEGSCIPLDLNHADQPSPAFCGRMTGRASGAHITDDAYGMTMAEIATRFLANRLDRPVIDKTGIAGTFDAHLEFMRDNGTTAPAADSEGPSIFTAVQEQLGIKLSADKGPVEVLVIDHVEKPDAN